MIWVITRLAWSEKCVCCNLLIALGLDSLLSAVSVELMQRLRTGHRCEFHPVDYRWVAPSLSSWGLWADWHYRGSLHCTPCLKRHLHNYFLSFAPRLIRVSICPVRKFKRGPPLHHPHHYLSMLPYSPVILVLFSL